MPDRHEPVVLYGPHGAGSWAWCPCGRWTSGLCQGEITARQRADQHVANAQTYEHPSVVLGDRFWSKVAIDGAGCWRWTAHCSSNGYGRFRADRKVHGAHRWAYTLLVGPVPDHLQLDHLCRNRNCVNPAHLEIVDNAENQRRRAPRPLPTHCVHGHLFDDQNTYVGPDGRRHCKACRAARERLGRIRRLARKKETAV